MSKIVELGGATDAAGDLTVTSALTYTGYVEKVVLDFGTWDALMDIALSFENTGVSELWFTKTDQGAADAIWYPRANAVDGADAAAFTAENATKYFCLGQQIKLVLADGGNVQTGKILIYLSDE